MTVGSINFLWILKILDGGKGGCSIYSPFEQRNRNMNEEYIVIFAS